MLRKAEDHSHSQREWGWVFCKGAYGLLEPNNGLVSWAVASVSLGFWGVFFFYFFFGLRGDKICFSSVSLQCCRRWFSGRSRRRTAWAWLRGVASAFRAAASSHLCLKVALIAAAFILLKAQISSLGEQNARVDSCICRALRFNDGSHIDPRVAEKFKWTLHTQPFEELVTV